MCSDTLRERGIWNEIGNDDVPTIVMIGFNLAKLNDIFFIEDPLRNPATIFFAREEVISSRLEGLQKKKINAVYRKKKM